MSLATTFSPQAKNDLIDISKYLSKHSHSATKQFNHALSKAISSLLQHPNLGHKRVDLTSRQVLFWHVIYHYSIVYIHSSTELYILRIISNYRDIKNIL